MTRSLKRDALWMLAAYTVQLAVPLLVVSFLARTLGVAGWGRVAAVLSGAGLLLAIPAFGFNLSAIRTLAQAPDLDARRSVVAGTVAAQALLTGVALAVGTLCVFLWTPARSPLGVAALVYVLGRGVAWSWVFEGLGRFSVAAGLVVLSRAPVPLLLWLFVAGPAQASRVPLAYAAAALLETVVGAWVAHRAGVLAWPKRHDVRMALRDSAPLFPGQLALYAYTAGGPFWLGLVSPVATVGVFAAAEQVVRAAAGALQAAARVILPSLS
ncbi:MAG TPA: oligosaccharide flippase family protein, partial [Rhodothermales bacterium]|nr:oligosaccharide flippase family protein [Rhodothermales bacterium]